MIIIDADACPSIKQIESLAKSYNIKVLICHDFSHHIISSYSEIQVVSNGSNSADTYIANRARENDIVITSDYGVAVTALAKKAYAISPNGLIYDDNNIDNLMYIRHINHKIRNKGYQVKGPKKKN